MAEESKSKPKPLRRSDYSPCPFALPKLSLDFSLNAPDDVIVKSKLVLQRAMPASTKADLALDGVDLKLQAVSIDNSPVDLSALQITPTQLIIPSNLLPSPNPNPNPKVNPNGDSDSFVVETVTKLEPSSNLSLEGLYMDGSGSFMTQCEANGFRRITYSLDRPDVLSVYTVSIEADKKSNPVLLSNGNLIREEELPEGRHKKVYHDPFMKPSYLFALVAGDLGSIKDTFRTASGRDVRLEIFSEHRNIDQLDYAMQSLKKAMAWDERVYALEYDLDVFNIVATDSVRSDSFVLIGCALNQVITRLVE